MEASISEQPEDFDGFQNEWVVITVVGARGPKTVIRARASKSQRHSKLSSAPLNRLFFPLKIPVFFRKHLPLKCTFFPRHPTLDGIIEKIHHDDVSHTFRFKWRIRSMPLVKRQKIVLLCYRYRNSNRLYRYSDVAYNILHWDRVVIIYCSSFLWVVKCIRDNCRVSLFRNHFIFFFNNVSSEKHV